MREILREKVLNLRKEGKTYKEIKTALACSMGVISYHCRRGGFNKHNKNPNSEQIAEFINLYNQGNSLKKVSTLTGFHWQTIGKYITFRRHKSKIVTHSEAVVSWRKRTKVQLVLYKGGKCVKCGYNKCIEALQFHHLNPKEKDFTISGKSLSFERLRLEADKCILLCANCHIETHHGGCPERRSDLAVNQT